MPLLKDLYPSAYLKADDIDEQGGEVRAIISKIKMEELQSSEGGKEDKPILYFLRTEKGLVLNKTNAMTIGAAYGPDTDGWTGKEILLVTEMVTAFGETKPAIRVRVRKAPAVKAAAPAAEAPPADPEETPF